MLISLVSHRDIHCVQSICIKAYLPSHASSNLPVPNSHSMRIDCRAKLADEKNACASASFSLPLNMGKATQKRGKKGKNTVPFLTAVSGCSYKVKWSNDVSVILCRVTRKVFCFE